MTSYGYEFETGFHFFTNVEVPAGTDMFEIRKMENGLPVGEVLIYIKADNPAPSDKPQFPYRSLLEAASPRYNLAPDANNFFDSLTKFFTVLLDKIEQGYIDIVPGNYWESPPVALQDVYRFTYIYNQPARIGTLDFSPPDPLEDQTITPQFTFGFNFFDAVGYDNEILKRFINHFNPVQYNNMQCFLAERKPFSDVSLDRFKQGVIVPAGVVSPDSLSSYRFFSVVEFIRLCIGFSLSGVITQSQVNILGNKAYMYILSRKSIKSIFLSAALNVNMLHLLEYIKSGFVPETAFKTPFSPSCEDENITLHNLDGTVEKLSYKDHSLSETYNDSVYSYWPLFQSISTHFVYNNDLDQARNNLLNQLTTKRNALINNRSMEIIQQIDEFINKVAFNIHLYDFMSPVPYSEPTDSMGLYTRTNQSSDQMFVLEVRYLSKFYPNPDELQYNQTFKTWCIDEFTLAYNNWNPLPQSTPLEEIPLKERVAPLEEQAHVRNI